MIVFTHLSSHLFCAPTSSIFGEIRPLLFWNSHNQKVKTRPVVFYILAIEHWLSPSPLGNLAVEALLMEIVKCEMKYSSFGFTVTSLTDVMLGCNNGSRRYYVTGWNDRCL